MGHLKHHEMYQKQKHRWVRVLRNGLANYKLYKVYAKKLRLLIRTAREQSYVQRLWYLNNYMQRNWKVLIGLGG